MQPKVRLHYFAGVSCLEPINRYSWDKKEHEWRIGDGVVQDTSGDVIFSVNFRAITCMPEVNEVLDGQVV